MSVFRSISGWTQYDTLKVLRSRKVWLPRWVHSTTVLRAIVAIITAVLAFRAGELFSSAVSFTNPWKHASPSGAGHMQTPSYGDRTQGAARREAIRETWLPRVRQQQGVEAKFIVGRTEEAEEGEDALSAEIRDNPDDFLVVDAEECESCGTQKILRMFEAVSKLYHVDWFLKVTDAVYVSPSHALAASRQWNAMKAGYVGCLQHKRLVEWVESDTLQDPDRDLMSWHYPAHAIKSGYALSGDVVRLAILPNSETLRNLRYEETSVGLWMLAFKVNFWDDMRLCTPVCGEAAVIVSNNACSGLCDPVADIRYHEEQPLCHTPVNGSLPYMPSNRENEMFQHMRV